MSVYNGIDIPMQTLAFMLLSGMNCLFTFPNMRSLPRKKLKWGALKLMAPPNIKPVVDAVVLSTASNHFTGRTFADSIA